MNNRKMKKEYKMPNGFHGTKEKWDQMESFLLKIDDCLKSFALVKHLNIEKNIHSWPSRSLLWEKDGIKRQIQIYIENEKKKTFNFWLCASHDLNNNRLWKNEFLKKNVLFSEISNNLDELLTKSYDIVNFWSLSDLISA